MISVLWLKQNKFENIEQVFEQATESFHQGKQPQARGLIFAMSRDQRKEYLLKCVELELEKPLLEFIINLL